MAVTTKEGIVNLGKGEKIDFAKLVNMAEVNSLLTRIPAIVEVGEDKEVVNKPAESPVEALKAVESVNAPVEAEKPVEQAVEASIDAPKTETPVYVKVEPVNTARKFGKKKNRR